LCWGWKPVADPLDELLGELPPELELLLLFELLQAAAERARTPPARTAVTR
jgi:hypothetical protein